MAAFERHVTTNWEGNLLEGHGEAKAGTGAFTLPVSFPSRVGEAAGKTSPEELMAAAHSACFAMALNAALGRKGASAEKTDVVATIVAERGEGGIKITTSKLDVTVYGLSGMEAEDFPAFAKEAEKGCPVSNAYRGSLEITVEGRAL